jgi:hypothetical protein
MKHYKMKKLSLYILLLPLLTFTSCGLFELDNYEEPAETIQGEVVDKATGKPVLTEHGIGGRAIDNDQGSQGIRVRMIETSWGENATRLRDIYCMPDGNFQNTKIFKGTYNVRIDGPFIPLLREDDRGVPLADETMDVDISGVKKVRFEVQPFLNVEWVEPPTIVNGKVSAKVRVTRGVSDEIFREKIEPMGAYSNSFLNVTDIQLFVSYSSEVGYRARDERWSSQIEYTGSSFNSLLGETVTIESIGTIPAGKVVFVRAAARINYETPKASGIRRWNYNAPVQLLIP